MKTASVSGPARIEIHDNFQRLVPGPGEILVRMKACGICGSDLEKVFGQYGQPSMRLGHEPAGVVVAVGPHNARCDINNDNDDNNDYTCTDNDDKYTRDGDVRNTVDFSVGDRVFAHHHVPCYSCHLCMRGRETMCPKYYETNLSPCGLSEEFIVPAWNVAHGGVLKLSDETTFEQAAMIEPLACCVRAWKKIDHHRGDTVAIFGVGPTGVMHVMLSVINGFDKIICLDLNDYRLDFARQMGSTHTIRSDDQSRHQYVRDTAGGRGVDVSIVATSSIAALADAIAMTRKGGTVMMFGVPSKGAMMNMDMSEIYSREITLSTSYAASDADTADALDLIESGRMDVKKLITHSYRLSESQNAFEHARAGRDAMKIIITGD